MRLVFCELCHTPLRLEIIARSAFSCFSFLLFLVDVELSLFSARMSRLVFFIPPEPTQGVAGSWCIPLSLVKITPPPRRLLQHKPTLSTTDSKGYIGFTLFSIPPITIDCNPRVPYTLPNPSSIGIFGTGIPNASSHHPSIHSPYSSSCPLEAARRRSVGRSIVVALEESGAGGSESIFSISKCFSLFFSFPQSSLKLIIYFFSRNNSYIGSDQKLRARSEA